MQEIDKEYVRRRVKPLLQSLKQKNFDPCFFESAVEATRFILDQIKAGETVGIGGSVTLRENLGIVPAIREKGNTVYDHWEADKDPVRRLELKRIHRGVDLFLSSVNAITFDGTMVNLDGGGNRVASLCSGPKRVIVIAGANKLVETLDAAIDRTRNRAAVLRVLRSKFQTPCEATGVCSDCSSPQRICAALLILMQKPADINHFTVILVNEELGY